MSKFRIQSFFSSQLLTHHTKVQHLVLQASHLFPVLASILKGIPFIRIQLNSRSQHILNL